MDIPNYFHKIKKHCPLERTVPYDNTIKYNKKIFFRINCFGSQSFFVSCHYIKTFVHLLIIAAINDFNIFKLISKHFLFELNSRNTRKRFEICPKLTIKTIEHCSCIFIVNFGHISHISLVLPLLTINRQMFFREFFLV